MNQWRVWSLVALMATATFVFGCELEEDEGLDGGIDTSDAGGGGGGTCTDGDGICGEGCGTLDSDCGGGGGGGCVSGDGVCGAGCTSATDSDCGTCTCDVFSGICNVSTNGSTNACTCDPDCGTPCGSDGTCDTMCPAGADPDCEVECECDTNRFCEAARPGTTDTCTCDDDCGAGDAACSADGHCDTFCPDGEDPDCAPTCDCDYNPGICEAEAPGASTACDCDEDCAGGLDPCKSDGHCDTWCPDGFDPDC